MSLQEDDEEIRDALYRVKRGLCGYVSYLAACEMNQAFSEYILYEPILRILTAQGFNVNCEYECPGVNQPKQGDKKRLDFYANGRTANLALEVKWITSKNFNIDRDIEKLRALSMAEPKTYNLLCFFGRKSFIEKLNFDRTEFKEWGRPVYADLRKTKYGCRIFDPTIQNKHAK